MAVPASFRSPRCIADNNNHLRHESAIEKWHVHIGHIKLYIVGPGENDWFPLTDSCYHGQVGTDKERAIAQRAAAILDTEHRYDRNMLDRAAIEAVLKRAAKEIKNHVPLKVVEIVHLVRSEPVAQPSPQQVKALVELASAELGYPSKVLLAGHRMSGEMSFARSYLNGSMFAAFPGIFRNTIARSLELHATSVADMRNLHLRRMANSMEYAAGFIRLCDSLNIILSES